MLRLCGLFLLPALLFGQAHPDSTAHHSGKPVARDLWLAKDKADHLICSAFLVGLGYYMAHEEMNRPHRQACTVGLGFSFSLGIAKEVYDRRGRKGTASWRDLAADALGCGLGYALITLGR
ncbi:MAG TPA: hypothetical protein PK843_15820 [bacterium]|nr:hypothetical protein [bacterium]HPN35983.1 hypothetical protein [bacterium]